MMFLDAKEDSIASLPSLLDAQYEIVFKAEGLEPGKSYPLKLGSTVANVTILVPRDYIAP